MAISDDDYKRIYWASRRGMLELDLMMVPFVEQKLRDLSSQDQQRYIRLLECEDNELFAWLMGREQPEDTELNAIITQIIAHAKSC